MSNKQFSSHCIQKNQTYCDLRHVLLPLLFTVGIDHSKYDILNLHTRQVKLSTYVQAYSKRSHSINMSNIQIDTKSLGIVVYHQFNNIKLSVFASSKKLSNAQTKTCWNTLQNSLLAKFCLLCNPKRIDEPLLCSMVLEIQSFFRSIVRLVFS